MAFFHSIRLDPDKCIGCTNCIKHCPTEAIRVRGGKAYILEDRCTDCGACIRVCPNDAIVAHTDSLAACRQYSYNVALPAPSLFGQFADLADPADVLDGLLALGFDAVFEVPLAADAVSQVMRRFIEEQEGGPWISVTCPAIVRLIQVRFPGLIPNLIRVEAPMEIAGYMAREEACRVSGLPDQDIGVWFITPCAAKVTAIYQPEGLAKSTISGAIAISEVYGDLLRFLFNDHAKKSTFRASGAGLGWGRAGGENYAVGVPSHLAVDGIDNVSILFEEVEKGRLEAVDFMECLACTGGCVGGALTVENPFISRVRLRKLAANLPKEPGLSAEEVYRDFGDIFSIREELVPRPMVPLDDDIVTAIAKMERLETLLARLPGLDCGACGAPNCRAFAEDVVRGIALENGCVIQMKNLWHTQEKRGPEDEA